MSRCNGLRTCPSTTRVEPSLVVAVPSSSSFGRRFRSSLSFGSSQCSEPRPGSRLERSLPLARHLSTLYDPHSSDRVVSKVRWLHLPRNAGCQLARRRPMRRDSVIWGDSRPQGVALFVTHAVFRRALGCPPRSHVATELGRGHKFGQSRRILLSRRAAHF